MGGNMKVVIIVIIIAISTVCQASDLSYGAFYNVEYVDNYDGDTITFNIPGVHPIIGKQMKVRIDGIDTPELKGKCKLERQRAMAAKIFIRKAFDILKDKPVTLENARRGKYFRIVADVKIGAIDIGKYMVQNNLAVAYDGGKKTKNWCI